MEMQKVSNETQVSRAFRCLQLALVRRVMKVVATEYEL